MSRRVSLPSGSADRHHADYVSTCAGGWPARYGTLFLLLFFTATFAHAQFDTAEVVGTIGDPSGAAVAGASVVLTDLARGIRVSRQTDASGSYDFTNVQAGDYNLTVRANGFEISVTDRFTVNEGARQRVDVGLKLGAQTENVTVSGAASELETDRFRSHSATEWLFPVQPAFR